MDVDAVIRRAPELALIDELAHTNAPGMRNEKRYQDIDEILDAGIDVISTVNVQHLESLNDAIFELTEIRVRETFPDRILDEADEVVLVDLTPGGAPGAAPRGQGLPARAGRGRARQLLPGREALARSASWRCARSPRTSRSGATRTYARAAQSAGGRRARARAVEPQPKSQRILRRAWRSAQRLGAEMDALWVRKPGHGRRRRRRRRSSPRCGASPSILGVHFLEEEGDDLVATVRRVAAERGSTYVFVGTPDESRRREIFGGSLLSRMVRELPGIDIRVVASRAERDKLTP